MKKKLSPFTQQLLQNYSHQINEALPALSPAQHQLHTALMANVACFTFLMLPGIPREAVKTSALEITGLIKTLRRKADREGMIELSQKSKQLTALMPVMQSHHQQRNKLMVESLAYLKKINHPETQAPDLLELFQGFTAVTRKIVKLDFDYYFNNSPFPPYSTTPNSYPGPR
jgi:hypothetical protein